MRILIVHNYYQQRGGEDESAEQDFLALSTHGHEVRLYSRHNDEIKDFNFLRKGMLFFESSWSRRSYHALARIIREFRPEVVHFQNTFPLISPAAYYVCRRNRVPVVQTLRNYRLFCPNGLLFRGDGICEECLSSSLWPGIRYGCYRNSRLQTASVALMLASHRLLGTWDEMVDGYIALSDFSRKKLTAAGLPEARIHIRPNFLTVDPGVAEANRGHALFVGRLSREKGLDTLLGAWQRLPEVPLKIVGDGPLRSWIQRYLVRNRMPQVELVGRLPSCEVTKYLRKAMVLVNPSLCYETFSRTTIEAYANATPVIASGLGALRELVKPRETGLLFRPGDHEDLARQVGEALIRPAELNRWGREARREFEEKYTVTRNYDLLMKIYQLAMDRSGHAQRPSLR